MLDNDLTVNFFDIKYCEDAGCARITNVCTRTEAQLVIFFRCNDHFSYVIMQLRKTSHIQASKINALHSFVQSSVQR